MLRIIAENPGAEAFWVDGDSGLPILVYRAESADDANRLAAGYGQTHAAAGYRVASYCHLADKLRPALRIYADYAIRYDREPTPQVRLPDGWYCVSAADLAAWERWRTINKVPRVKVSVLGGDA